MVRGVPERKWKEFQREKKELSTLGAEKERACGKGEALQKSLSSGWT